MQYNIWNISIQSLEFKVETFGSEILQSLPLVCVCVCACMYMYIGESNEEVITN